MPVVRPFRALRYDLDRIPSLSAVIAPPYDVVAPAERERLVERDERNVIRLELPIDEPGDEPDARYRRAARTLAAWRSDGTLRKDPRPAFYVYEQSYEVPGTGERRTQRGVFARLRLEPLERESGVRRHEWTMSAPKEDRYRLLRATGTNVSPVVGLYEDETGEAAQLLDGIVAQPPIGEAVDDAGVGHRLWVADEPSGLDLGALSGRLGAGPITIADGHHRYETALRYRDERRMTRSCEEDPAFDYVLALLLDVDQPLTILPTHRIVRGLSPADRRTLSERLDDVFERPAASVDPAELARRWDHGIDGHRPGRSVFGFLAPEGGSIIETRPGAAARLVADGRAAVRSLDVAVLAGALERLAGIGPDAVAGGRLEYTHSAEEAAAAVERDGDVAFLVEPTPVRSVIEVAAAGDVMPQKSTYFYPKAATGLVLNPHEW